MQNDQFSALNDLLTNLRDDSAFYYNITCWKEDLTKEPQLFDIPNHLHPALRAALAQNDIHSLYSHQVEAFKRFLAHENMIISTGTSSGKSICYQVPIINSLLEDETASALLFFPTKALTNDQLGGFANLVPPDFRSACRYAIFDGDTPQAARKAIRERANVIFTNPDMLNIGILPNHTLWESFFSHLKCVVIDEIHIYRGVFGSHIANLMRRLHRVCRFYGSGPIFVMTSATIHNPDELSKKLIGEEVSLIDQDGSPKGKRHFLVYNPPFINEELGIREGLVTTTGKFLSLLYSRSIQTLVFCRTRKFVEILKREISSVLRIPSHRIRGYRSGYLRTERREIEEGLKRGEILIGIATNALELGVDIGGVDAVLLPGYPGTIAALLQRAGRAGRKFHPSLAVFIASMNPLDQYLARNPEYLLSRNPEDALINPDNPLILLEHLQCAAAELPFDTLESFGSLGIENTGNYLDFLVENGVLHQSNGTYTWVSSDYPSQHVSLRSTASTNILLESEENGQRKVIGEIDYNSGLWMVHPGAIYLHDGETYKVETLDLEKNIAILSPSQDDYLTEPVISTDVEVLSVNKEMEFKYYRKFTGEIVVNSKVEGYKRMLWGTRDVIDQFELDLPSTSLRTVGYWITLSEDCVNQLRESGSWMSDRNDYGADWQKIRNLVRARDQFICQVCGRSESDGEHHVHHKIPFKLFADMRKANALSNLVTLCHSCHRLVESQMRVRSVIAGLKFTLESLSPLMVMCDAGDLAGFADPAAKFAEKQPSIIFYDNIPAGIGLSEHIYDRLNMLLSDAKSVIENCSCADGCPSCVGPSQDNSIGGKKETLELINLLLDQQ